MRKKFNKIFLILFTAILFVACTNVNEIHNNTDTMKISGFNQENGKVTGNIKNLEIESVQNTSKTKGSSKGGSIGISLTGGLPTGNIHASKTKGDKDFVENQTTFIVGENSNLKVENVDNTASVIGTKQNGKIEIENYIGKNLHNKEKLETKGGSIGTSGVGIQNSKSEKEGISRNTVVGNVEINKATGDEINTDISKANEITKEKSKSTNIFAENQLIEAVAKPKDFKEKITKAKQELKDIREVVKNTIENKGKDKRNFIELLNSQKRATTINNLLGEDIKNILSQKDDKEIQKDFSELIQNFGKDLGINVKVEYTTKEGTPKESKGKPASAFVDSSKKEMVIVINKDKIKTTSALIGATFEELSHVLDKVAGRQDEKVAKDKTTDEKGLESLGRPVNDYFKEQYSDNDKKIELTPTADLSNKNIGEHVGDFNPAIIAPIYIALSNPQVSEEVITAISTILLTKDNLSEEEINKKREEIKELGKAKEKQKEVKKEQNGGNSGKEPKNKNKKEKTELVSKGEYKQSPKHNPKTKWQGASESNIPDQQTGQKLLDKSYGTSNLKQKFSYYKGKIIKFQPANDGTWHDYIISNKKEIPTEVLRKMRDDKVITKVEYSKFINGHF